MTSSLLVAGGNDYKVFFGQTSCHLESTNDIKSMFSEVKSGKMGKASLKVGSVRECNNKCLSNTVTLASWWKLEREKFETIDELFED